MDESTLRAKKKAASDQFDEQVAEKEKLDARLVEIDDELKRLQGEWRAYDGMISELSKATLAAPATDPANTVTAEPEVEKKATRGK